MWKGNRVISEFIKWTATSFIAILIGNYLILHLGIEDPFLVLILTSGVISILIHAVRTHDKEFSFSIRWFLFYFLSYMTIIEILTGYIFPEIGISGPISSTVITALIISIAIILIEKMKIKYRTIPWISVILLCLILVANLSSLQTLLIVMTHDEYQNSSINNENKQLCPLPRNGDISALAYDINYDYSVRTKIEELIDNSIWKIENKLGPCYAGKYQGQHPDRIYCDNLIVSRWDTDGSGAINYRWYTAVTAEWMPISPGSGAYKFTGLYCENGQKVIVSKETTNYYVYYSRDGSQIRIAY